MFDSKNWLNIIQIDPDHYIVHTPNVYATFFKENKQVPDRIEKLFKFYKFNDNNIDSLLNSYLYVANPADFNDPHDCSLNLLKNLPFDLNLPKKNDYGNIGVCSFSESITNPVLWATYANDYTGFALEFDDQIFSIPIDKNKIDSYVVRKVIYAVNPAKIDARYFFATNYALTTKTNDWLHENEWRVIAVLSGESEYRKIYYPKAILKAIYIGYKLFESEAKYNVLNLIFKAIYDNVPIKVVSPHSSAIGLDIRDIK